MAVYEQVRNGDTLFTYLKEFSIYGADRLGLCNTHTLIRKECIGPNCDALGDPGDPGNKRLLITEIFYDSPLTDESAIGGEEIHSGEYVVLLNNSDRSLDLSSYQLRNATEGSSVALSGTLAPEARIVLGFTENLNEFAQITAMPSEYLAHVQAHTSLILGDEGGQIALDYVDANADAYEVDRMAYGEFYALSAENAYISSSQIDSLELRSSLNSVQRRSWSPGPGLDRPEVDVIVGNVDPGVRPRPVEDSWSGKYSLLRGAKMYEMSNHLGNVLAVVSDLKLGVGDNVSTPQAPWAVDYYTADVVSMQEELA